MTLRYEIRFITVSLTAMIIVWLSREPYDQLAVITLLTLAGFLFVLTALSDIFEELRIEGLKK